MDLPVCFILATVLFVTTQADPTDQGPQIFSNLPPTEKPLEEKKQHKRQSKYEEVILYLTPSQIRAYESGKGLMTPQQAAELRASEEGRGLLQQPQPIQYGTPNSAQEVDQSRQTNPFGREAGRGFSKPNQQLLSLEPPRQSAHALQKGAIDLSNNMNEQLKEMQSFYNDAGQKLHQEVKKLDTKKKERIQLEDQKKHKSSNDKLPQQLAPENNSPQSPQLELQQNDNFIELPAPINFFPQEWSHVQQRYGDQVEVPHFGQPLISPPAPQLEQQQLIPIVDPQLINFPLRHEKTELTPQNYAYLYFYPHGKTWNQGALSHIHSPLQEQKPKELFIQQEPDFNLHLHSKFQLVPYEYGYQNKLEAKQILQAQLGDHHLDTQRFDTHKIERHPPENFDTQQLIHKHFEPQHQNEKVNFEEKKYEPHEIKLKIVPHTAALRAQASKEIKVNIKNLNTPFKHEIMEVYEAQKLKARAEAEEKEAHRLDAQLKEEELKAERFKAEQLKEELFKSQEFKEELFKSVDFRDVLLNNQGFKNELFRNHEFQQALLRNHELKEELFKNQEWKGDPFKNQELKEHFSNQEYREEPIKNQKHKEEEFHSHESDENSFKNQEIKVHLYKSQPSKDELFKGEYTDLGYLQKLEPKRTQMHSILNPLFQGHSITESLQQQKASFPHHNINLETGFKPLQYAPKFIDQKYAREVEKIMQRNHVEKQKALAKAAAIANEPPKVIRTEEKLVMEPMEKHVDVPMPTPVMMPVPTPIEVKVPHPYPEPLEIIRPYPISIVKTEKVEVQKPIPIEIEKRVPVSITKNIYVKVEKPHFVPKVVPVELKREMPVERPVKQQAPLKLSIIKHIWEH